jgi:hypothetical protein
MLEQTLHGGERDGIDSAASYLVTVLDGEPAMELVRQVLLSARDDLRTEVPPEALPEFLHRLAHQRLVDLLAVQDLAH